MLSCSLEKAVSAFPEFYKNMFDVNFQKYSLKFRRHRIPVDLSINYIKGKYVGIVWMKPISFLSKALKIIANALAYKVYIRPEKEKILSLISALSFPKKV